MNRRKALTSLAATPLLAAENSAKPQYYELRYYQLRNGVLNTMPVTRPAGITGTFGAFNSFIAPDSPFLLMLLTYSSFAEAEHIDEKLPAITGYIRSERTILRAFPGAPQLTVPPASKTARIFELRTYESNDASTLKKKIEMFDNGEAKIFQRLGMKPVFFGEALVGARLPHLTYMLAFDDLAHRDRAWKAFGSDPEWKKMSSAPGYSDADIVSNISNVILRPTAFSDIR